MVTAASHGIAEAIALAFARAVAAGALSVRGREAEARVT